MKDIVEEMNQIHSRIAELRGKINDLEKVAHTGNFANKSIRDEVINARMKGLVEEYGLLIARLKKVFD